MLSSLKKTAFLKKIRTFLSDPNLFERCVFMMDGGKNGENTLCSTVAWRRLFPPDRRRPVHRARLVRLEPPSFGQRGVVRLQPHGHRQWPGHLLQSHLQGRPFWPGTVQLIGHHPSWVRARLSGRTCKESLYLFNEYMLSFLHTSPCWPYGMVSMCLWLLTFMKSNDLPFCCTSSLRRGGSDRLRRPRWSPSPRFWRTKTPSQSSQTAAPSMT